MVDKEEEKKRTTDPFDDFLFGSRSKRLEDDSRSSKDDWVLGRRESNEEAVPSNKVDNPNPIEKVMNNVNFLELFTHLDTLMTSAQKLKPLYGNIKPIINQFINKK